MSFRKRLTWLICSGCLALVLSDRVRAAEARDSDPARAWADLPEAGSSGNQASADATNPGLRS